MEEEKIDRILKLVNMLEVTDENREDIAKIKQLINEKKYNEMLLLVKKVTSKRENNEEKKKIKIIEDNENLNKNNAFGTNNSIREEESWAEIVLIQCYMGWRPQELGLIELEKVDLENWEITGGMKTKAGTNRTVPIHPRIRPLVVKWYNTCLGCRWRGFDSRHPLQLHFYSN